MAQQRILQIPVGMIDPVNRNIVPTRRIPWGHLQQKCFPTKKCPPNGKSSSSLSFRDENSRRHPPAVYSALVPAGREDFGVCEKIPRKILWGWGHSRAIARFRRGTRGHLGANLTGTKRFMTGRRRRTRLQMSSPFRSDRRPRGCIRQGRFSLCSFVVVRVRVHAEAQSSSNRLQGLDLLSGTTAFRWPAQEDSLVDWRHYTKMQEYLRLVVEAYGFPKAGAVGKK